MRCIVDSSKVISVSVYPSGRALAPAVCPTAPLPPVLLTTTNGLPNFFSNSPAQKRAIWSVPPPGAQGQITVTARFG